MPPTTAIDDALATHHHYRRHAAWIAAAVICVTAAGYGVYRLAFYRAAVGFSYGQAVCVRDFTLLPRLFESQPSDTLRAEPAGLRSLAGYPLLATSTCIRVTGPPPAGRIEIPGIRLTGVGFVAKRYAVNMPLRPALESQSVLDQPLPVGKNLRLVLDTADIIHTYAVTADGRRVDCRAKERELLCDITKLQLGQGKEYELAVEQRYGGRTVATAAKKKVRTTSPVIVLQTAIAPGTVVYDKPDRLQIRTDKQLRQAEATMAIVGKAGERTPVTVRTEVSKDSVTVVFGQPLARGVSYELTLLSAVSTGQGFLEKPYTLGFTTSGPPKPQSTNIGSRAVARQPVITVTFDQPLKPGTDAASLVSLKAGDAAVPLQASLAGSVLTIRPQQIMPRCAKLTLRVAGTTANAHDVSGAIDWTYRSRTICHTVETIGRSVRGRAIQAYRFGSGASKVLYLGATHGDERGTRRLMDIWIDSLEAEPDRIPAHRSIIVIPSLNPDGYAADSRRNSNGVDLNRNFPANNWKPDVTMPGGALAVGGGGSAALSEPESQALAQFVSAETPRLTLTYHSVGSLVQPNGAGDSLALAQAYSANSRYYVLAPGAVSPFLYDTTGAFEDWLYDKLGLPALVIELSDHDASDWSRNAAAMWKMVQMP